MPRAIELISTERTGIPGLCVNCPFFPFLVRLNTSRTEKGTGHNSVQGGALLCPLQGRQGRSVQMGLPGGQINSPNRTEAFLPARRVMALCRTDTS